MKPRVHRAFFVLLSGSFWAPLAAWSDDWPQWRGPARTGHAAAEARALKSLARELAPVWKIAVGAGFSSPVVARGKLVYLDEKDGVEVAHLLKAATGKPVWTVAYGDVFEDEW